MKFETIYGIHSVKNLLQMQPERVVELHILKKNKNLDEILSMAEELGVNINYDNKKKYEVNTQGVIAYCKPAKKVTEQDLYKKLENIEKPLLLILDSIQDPHNLGACLRTADAAGVHAVIIPKNNAADITPVVKKVASGAAESIPVVAVSNLKRVIGKLKELGIWVVGLAGEGENSVYDVDFNMPRAIVMGNEGDGIKKTIKEECDELAFLPMKGIVSSLNVSVATGVVLYEALRQINSGKSP